jgi:hypothetical protein
VAFFAGAFFVTFFAAFLIIAAIFQLPISSKNINPERYM